MANAILSIPLFLFSLLLGLQGGYGARVAQTVLMLASTLLFIYIMLVLLDFLNKSHGFHATDLLIKIQLWINIAATIISMLGLLSQAIQQAGGMLVLSLLIPSGIVQALFGYRLLRFPDKLNGRLKSFCVLTMITGVSVALVVSIPLGVLTSAAADVILGKIFLTAGRKTT